MTDEQRQKITNLRAAGNGYKKISKLLGLSENTVKSFCQRRKREIIYQMTMSAARQMLEKGLISVEEYKQFDTKMQQKYSPIFGTLFSNINLQ